MTTTNKARDEAAPDAARPAEQSTNMAATTDAALEGAEAEAKRADIDTRFREDVNKAAEKRNKALSKLPAERRKNIAETAWNETKAEDDPDFNAVTPDHRAKLNYTVQTVRETGNADIVGLEAFEAKVKELLADEKEAEGTPSGVPARAKAQATEGK